jgi:trehalose 6-phosphate phosphatase
VIRRIPHATERVPHWIEARRRTGRLVLLLDFDGTLAPIAARPELARPLPAPLRAIDRLRGRRGVDLGVVSGRALGDVRDLVGIRGIIYAGNHGMEIDGPGFRMLHPDAEAARPTLERAAHMLERGLQDIAGAWVEDKGLTLSVHYRQVRAAEHARVRAAVKEAVGGLITLWPTEGKMVIEIRPRVDWHKGRAVEFLLDRLRPPDGAPVLYVGDDLTDEDAFAAVRDWSGGSGDGVLVADTPLPTAATCTVRDPKEVAELLAALATG